MKWFEWKDARVLAIFLLAFALRLVTIETRPLWYDDAFSVFLSERGLAAIASGTAADTMPPGYYALLSLWMNGFGQTPLALRMLSVSLSMLGIALVYVIARRAFGATAGHWAMLLAALMPFQIYHAQELRMYTLLALGGLIYVYGVMLLAVPKDLRAERVATRAHTENYLPFIQWRAWSFVALGTIIALYAHNLAFVTLLAGNIFFLLTRAWRKQGQLILAQVCGALFFTPWLVYVPTQLEKIQRAFWTPQPSLLQVVQMVLEFTTLLPLPPLFIALALTLSILILVIAIWQVIKCGRRKTFPALGVLVAFALVPPILLFLVSYLIRPVFVSRGAIVSALVYAMLVGAVASSAPRMLQRALLVLTILLYGALLPFYYSAYGEWRRAPYANADAFLREQWRAGDVILHDNKLTFFPMYYYDRALPQVFLADPPQSDNDTFALASQQAMESYPTEFQNAVGGKTRVWFVIYQTALDEANAANVPHANLARLDDSFQRVQENQYGDVRLFLYTIR